MMLLLGGTLIKYIAFLEVDGHVQRNIIRLEKCNRFVMLLSMNWSGLWYVNIAEHAGLKGFIAICCKKCYHTVSRIALKIEAFDQQLA